MIPQQQLVAFPEFANTGTKVPPEAAKYAAGFQESDVLPAEWLNYFLNKASAGQTANNAVADSVQKELQNIVAQAGETPSAGDNTQVYKAIRSFIATKTNTMICTTDVDEAPAVSGYDYINEYYDGLAVEVLFKNGHYGADASANLTFEIGELGAKKVYTPKDGETVLVKSNSVDRSDGYGTKNWFMQPFTSLKMMYDSSLDDNAGGWVVLENAVVLSNSSSTSGYTIYADGNIEYNKSTVDTLIGNINNLYAFSDFNDCIPSNDKVYVYQSIFQPANKPYNYNYWLCIAFHYNISGINDVVQIAIAYNAPGSIWVRNSIGGEWAKV